MGFEYFASRILNNNADCRRSGVSPAAAVGVDKKFFLFPRGMQHHNCRIMLLSSPLHVHICRGRDFCKAQTQRPSSVEKILLNACRDVYDISGPDACAARAPFPESDCRQRLPVRLLKRKRKMRVVLSKKSHARNRYPPE